MERLKAIIIAIVIGSLLGGFFMFLILGYFKSNTGPGSAFMDSLGVLPDTTPNSITADSSANGNAAYKAADDIDNTRRNAIVRAADKVGPAVVSLSVIQVVHTRSSSPLGNDFWGFLFLPPPSRERKVLSLGSGVIINPEGYILTNNHVVEGAKEIKVTLISGDEYPGRMIGTDPVTDLAVVKIIADKPVKFPNVVLGDSDDMIIGEWAIAIGNPFGYLLEDPKPTVTVGVISATNRDIKPEEGMKAVYRKMIQTDASINPGNSGGPLVNALGEVIGINTFIFTSGRGSEGIGFAVPINRAKLVINDLLKFGEVVKAWIGLNVHSITPDIAQSLDISTNHGLIISSVSDNSPAARAGLIPGDLLLKVGKSEMKSVADWDEMVTYARAGRALGLNILRNSKEFSIVVVPEEIPSRVAPAKTDKFGLKVAEITPGVASFADITDRQGVMVIGAVDTSWAAGWGLREDDIIRQIGRRKIENLDDYIDIMAKIGRGYRLVFMIQRNGKIIPVQVIT